MDNSVVANYLGQFIDLFLEDYSKTFDVLKERSTIGYFTNKVPIEILHALNTVPVRIVSLRKHRTNQGASEKYIQAFGCSWLQQVIDLGLEGGFSSLNGIIFSAGTCDSLQNVADIWRKIFPDQWAYNLTFPVLNSNFAQEYLQNEFERLIAIITRKFPDNKSGFKLTESIKKYNLKRSYFQKLAILVSERNLSYYEFSKLLYLGDILPVEFINNYLETEVENIESEEIPKNRLPESPRIAITGGKWDNFELWKHPEFDYVVTDDLAFGTRNFNFMIPQGNFIEGYTRAYLERTPEATAYDMEKRIIGLMNLIKNHSVDGVIMLNNKFCDPDAFEFVPIQNQLKELEIPYLKIEASSDLSNIEQIKTRTSAFIEMIS